MSGARTSPRAFGPALGRNRRLTRMVLATNILITTLFSCSALAPSSSFAHDEPVRKRSLRKAIEPADTRPSVENVWSQNFVLSRSDRPEVFKLRNGQELVIDFRTAARTDTLFGGNILEVRPLGQGAGVSVEVKSSDVVSVEYKILGNSRDALADVCFLVTSTSERLRDPLDLAHILNLGEDSEGGLPVCIRPEFEGASMLVHVPRALGPKVKLYAVRRPDMDHPASDEVGANGLDGSLNSSRLASSSSPCTPLDEILAIELIHLDMLTRTTLSLKHECRAEGAVFGALMTGPPKH